MSEDTHIPRWKEAPRTSALPPPDDPAERKPLEEQFNESQHVLAWFSLLPKRYKNKRITVEFVYQPIFSPTSIRECEGLKLSIGETVSACLDFKPGDRPMNVYASGELAEELLKVPAGEGVLARAYTVFGEGWTIESAGCDEFRVTETYEGLVLCKFGEQRPVQAQQRAEERNAEPVRCS